jgi:hypothetical protein
MIMNIDEESALSKELNTIPSLMGALGSGRGVERERARRALVDIGHAAVPALTAALQNPQSRVRWEAAKSLVEIRDVTAAPALAHALMDKEVQVQWVAAEALIALGRSALEPVLEALVQDFDSANLRHGAHHVLHDLKQAGLLNAKELKLLESLDVMEPEVMVPLAAQDALRALRKQRHANA